MKIKVQTCHVFLDDNGVINQTPISAFFIIHCHLKEVWQPPSIFHNHILVLLNNITNYYSLGMV